MNKKSLKWAVHTICGTFCTMANHQIQSWNERAVQQNISFRTCFDCPKDIPVLQKDKHQRNICIAFIEFLKIRMFTYLNYLYEINILLYDISGAPPDLRWFSEFNVFIIPYVQGISGHKILWQITFIVNITVFPLVAAMHSSCPGLMATFVDRRCVIWLSKNFVLAVQHIAKPSLAILYVHLCFIVLESYSTQDFSTRAQ